MKLGKWVGLTSILSLGLILAACGSTGSKSGGGALGGAPAEGTAQSKTLQLSKSANAGEQWLAVHCDDENATTPNRHSQVQWVFNFKPNHKLQVIYFPAVEYMADQKLAGDELTLGDLKGLSQSQVTAKAIKVAKLQGKDEYGYWKTAYNDHDNPIDPDLQGMAAKMKQYATPKYYSQVVSNNVKYSIEVDADDTGNKSSAEHLLFQQKPYPAQYLSVLASAKTIRKNMSRKLENWHLFQLDSSTKGTVYDATYAGYGSSASNDSYQYYFITKVGKKNQTVKLDSPKTKGVKVTNE